MSEEVDQPMETETSKSEDPSDVVVSQSNGKDDEKEEDDEEPSTPKASPRTKAEKSIWNKLQAGLDMSNLATESYTCKECNRSFTRKSKLDYHVANAHPKEEEVEEEKPKRKYTKRVKTPGKDEKVSKKEEKAAKKEEKAQRKEEKAQKQLILQSSLPYLKDNKISLMKHQMQMPKVIMKPMRQPKFTTVSNEKVKYNWGYYCTACDMYFANMFAQQFHCLHGQAKFRCEACCICFKLRKNFMSHVQMVHGVDIPEEVLARMRPRSEIRAKQEAETDKTAGKVEKSGKGEEDAQEGKLSTEKQASSEGNICQDKEAMKESEVSENLQPKDGDACEQKQSTADVKNTEMEIGPKPELSGDLSNQDKSKDVKEMAEEACASKEKDAAKGEEPTEKTDDPVPSKEMEKSENDKALKEGVEKNEESSVQKGSDSVTEGSDTAKATEDKPSATKLDTSVKQGNESSAIEGKESKPEEEPDVILISESPAKGKDGITKTAPLRPKAVSDVKQSESGGNSSADESDKKDEGRVYLTTVRMGNTYVTLPSGEKWMIECLRCHQAFFKMEDASGHMKQRSGTHFSCPHCQYNSTLFSQCDYEIHRLRTHSFPCAQCRQSFILECQRDMHELKIHNYKRQPLKKKPYALMPHKQASNLSTASPYGKTVVMSNNAPSSHSIGKSIITNRDVYTVTRTQRTPYVCLMCDRDCYTRDSLEHHKKTFHAAIYRSNSKYPQTSKSSIIYKQTHRVIPGYSGDSVQQNASSSRKVLSGIRPVSTLANTNTATIANSLPAIPPASQFEPNKVPLAYITRIKVTLPEAKKLVEEIRQELIKGPAHFTMPQYAKPTKFNRDMVSNPAVVKLSREVALKLYFDLQGPCNESDKVNYSDKHRFKIPMGNHSQKLNHVPLFPTMKDIEYRTKNYRLPPLNILSPLELFAHFRGDLSMEQSTDFARELDMAMYGYMTKTVRAMSLSYSSRRVAVSDGFWKLQTKALIAILKDVEEQRKAQIAERAKAATVAASAAAAAAANARPIGMKLPQTQPIMQTGGIPTMLDIVNQQAGAPATVVQNGNIVGQTNPGQPVDLTQPVILQQLMQTQAGGSNVYTQPVLIQTTSPTRVLAQASIQTGVTLTSSNSTGTVITVSPFLPPATTPTSTETSTSPRTVPSLKSLARKAAGKEEEKEEKGEKEEEKAEEKKEEKEEEKKDEEPEKKENGAVNGTATPPPGDGPGPVVNGTQNDSTDGGSPTGGTPIGQDSKVVGSVAPEAVQKGTKPGATEGGPTGNAEQVNNVPNGTVHAVITGGIPQGLGVNGMLNLTLGNGGISLLNGVPVQLGSTLGTVGNFTLGAGGNGLKPMVGGGLFQGGAFVGGGAVVGGSGTAVASGRVLPNGGVIQRGGGNGVVLSSATNPVRLVPFPKLADSVGAVSAVASAPVTNPLLVLNNQAMSDPKGQLFTLQKPLIAQKPILPNTELAPVSSVTKTKLVDIRPKNEQLYFLPINKAKSASTAMKQLSGKLAEVVQASEPKKVSKEKDTTFSKIEQSVSAIKQLAKDNFLPDDLWQRIRPRCDQISASSTPAEKKMELSQEIDSIIKAELQGAQRSFDQLGGIRDGNSSDRLNTSEGGTASKTDKNQESQAGEFITSFLVNLSKRIRYIQSRLTTRSVDPVTLTEIVPMCQDVCDAKVPLQRKVKCVEEIERMIRAYEDEVKQNTSRSEASTPINIAAIPAEVPVSYDDDEEDAVVYCKLLLPDNERIMVNMNELELAAAAVASAARAQIILSKVKEDDVSIRAQTVKKKKGSSGTKRKGEESVKTAKKQKSAGTERGKDDTPLKDTKKTTETGKKQKQSGTVSGRDAMNKKDGDKSKKTNKNEGKNTTKTEQQAKGIKRKASDVGGKSTENSKKEKKEENKAGSKTVRRQSKGR